MIQQSNTAILVEFLKLIMPLLVGISSGLLGGWFATRFKLKEITETFKLERSEKEEEARAKVKLQYLDPLRISTEDLFERLTDIKRRLDQRNSLLRDTIKQLKVNRSGKVEGNLGYELWRNEHDFFHWANDMGHFTVSTLYLTTVYFACASRLRYDLPSVELSYSDDAILLNYLNSVRKAMGGPYGVWEDLQDSFGSYIRKENGSLMNYRDFCKDFFEENRYLWYMRLIDFYEDIDLKTNSEIEEMINALEGLSKFLRGRSKYGSFDQRNDSKS